MPTRSIRVLQTAMECGDISAHSLVEDCLDRVERSDGGNEGLHAILEVNAQALEIASQRDEERSHGALRGRLHGIPIVLKANIDTADTMQTTAGSLALEGQIATQDAFLVTRLRSEGAILLGKANLSEWANFRGAHSVSGWSSLGGQTRNPHNPRRSPCGSSSGSAAAVAAGYSPLAVGTETDGSIVCPAQTCGVVGIKPTLGLVSRSGIIPIAPSQDTAGPMAGCVEDAAVLLAAMAGTDASDPATAAMPDAFSLDVTSSLSKAALAGARIGVARDYFGKHPKVDALMESHLQLLRSLGAEVIDPAPIETAGKWRDQELLVLLYEFKDSLNAYLGELGEKAPVHSLEDVIAFNRSHADLVLPHFGQELMEQAQAKGDLTTDEYVQARAACKRLTQDEGIDATLREYRLDALVAPSGAPAWLIDHILGDLHLGGCSSPAAVAGYPHVTVPAGKIGNLPVGLSFFSTAWQDARLIRYAYAFEQGLASVARSPR